MPDSDLAKRILWLERQTFNLGNRVIRLESANVPSVEQCMQSLWYNPYPCTTPSFTLAGVPPGTDTFGSNVHFTATFSGSPTPTGTVQFQIDGSNFGSPATLSSGVATSGTTSTMAVGTHTIVANYSGDSVYCPGTQTISYTITSSGGTVSFCGCTLGTTCTWHDPIYGSIALTVVNPSAIPGVYNIGGTNSTTLVNVGAYGICGSQMGVGITVSFSCVAGFGGYSFIQMSYNSDTSSAHCPASGTSNLRIDPAQWFGGLTPCGTYSMTYSGGTQSPLGYTNSSTGTITFP